MTEIAQNTVVSQETLQKESLGSSKRKKKMTSDTTSQCKPKFDITADCLSNELVSNSGEATQSLVPHY